MVFGGHPDGTGWAKVLRTCRVSSRIAQVRNRVAAWRVDRGEREKQAELEELMSVPLAKGGNVSLSKEAPGLVAVTVGVGWRLGAASGDAYELDASALVCGRDGKVLSDRHFVFFNNVESPDGSVTHQGGGAGGEDNELIQVDLARVPAEVAKIVFAVSLYEAARRGQSFGHLAAAHIRVLDRDGGRELARYDLKGDASAETAMVFGELYRHGAEWKFRAVGQGYASGLAGIATDYGVDVLRESAPQPQAVPVPAAAPVPAPAPVAPPPPSYQPTTFTASQQTAAAVPPSPSGGPSMTCFFDPNHGPGTASVTWSPQWGVPRPIQACGACAQRVQTTPPPYYSAPQAGYPQAQAGYPQTGYPQQGYPQPAQQGYPQQAGGQQGQGQGQGRRFGTGALIGAGAAGLVGGALLNEAFSDDEPDVIVNNYYED